MPGIYRFMLAVLVATTLSVTATASADDWENLTGRILVAKADLQDPNFRESVIYLCRHDRTGAFGLMLNRPIATVPFSKLAKSFGIDSNDQREVRVRQGGPVEIGLGFVIHSRDFNSKETVCAGDGFEVTANLDVVRAIAHGEGPKRRIFLFGYAGWGAGQLESEIERGSWEVIPGDPKLLFDDDPASLWHRAFERRGINL